MRIRTGGVGAVAVGAWVSVLLASCAPVAWGSYAGTLDPTFGSGGIAVAQPVPGSTDFADSLALQPDGRVVVGAYASAEPSNGNAPSLAVVARLQSNGRPDRNFGQGGYVVLSGLGGIAPSSVPFDEPPPITPVRLKVLLTGDGHILVLGSSLVMLNSDGRVDASFGLTGKAQLPSGFTAAGMALAPKGAIVLVGNEQLSTGAAGAVVRLTAEGKPDPTFAAAGIVVLPRVEDAKVRVVSALDYRGVAVAGDGSITAAGVGRASSELFAPRDGLLARLNPDGSLHTAFGKEGQTLVESFGFQTIDSFEPNTLILKGDDGVLVGAVTCAKFGPCYADVDAFASDGVLTTHIASEESGCSPSACQQAVTLALLPDGGLIGAAWEGQMLLDRFDPSLNLVQAFGTSDAGSDLFGGSIAVAPLPLGSQMGGNMLVLPDGEIILAGSVPAAAGGHAILVARVFGLALPPPPRLSVPSRRVHATQRAASVLLDCHPHVSCRGSATLRVQGSDRRRGTILASGSFNIASGGSGLVVMPFTRVGRGIRASSLRSATLRLWVARKTTSIRVLVSWPPLGRRTSAPGALEPLASDVNGFDSDGRRYVIFIQSSTVHLLDTLTQHTYSVRVPAGCTDSAQRAVSFPMVLLSCGARDMLVDVTDRHVRSLPSGDQWGNIGRLWVGPHSAENCPNDYVCHEYLDWHTGAVQRIDSPPAPKPVNGALNEVPARNLNSANLTPVASCPPLQATNLEESLVAYPRLYQPPYLIYGQAIETFNGGPAQTARGLWLGRCGTNAVITLDAGAGHLDNNQGEPGDQVGAGIVSWYSPANTTVKLYEIRQKRRLSWTAPDARADMIIPAAVAHTRHTVIIATATHQLCQGESCHTDSWILYQAKLR